jgi:prepilin-type N-terminal cleavage/methylation domain-containing protein
VPTAWKAEEMILRAGRKRRRRSNRSGFTLIELALVAAIILSLIALSTPLFRKTISYLALQEASFNISKLINYAQERAVIDNDKNYKIALYVKNGQYRFLEFYTDADTKKAVERPLSGRFGKLYRLPRGVTFIPPDTELKKERTDLFFYPDGHCSKATIDLFNAQGGHYQILTKGFGGLVEVKEIKGE